MNKVDSRTLPVKALNERRRRAVKIRLAAVKLKDTAAPCDISRTSVITALKAYQPGGRNQVEVALPGRPEAMGLKPSVEQECKVQRVIRERSPDQLKVVYAQWTGQVVAPPIRHRYGIEFSCAP